eukprot:scaffold13399_cov50-Attheya_sp.AAC.2
MSFVAEREWESTLRRRRRPHHWKTRTTRQREGTGRRCIEIAASLPHPGEGVDEMTIRSPESGDDYWLAVGVVLRQRAAMWYMDCPAQSYYCWRKLQGCRYYCFGCYWIAAVPKKTCSIHCKPPPMAL